MSKAFIAKVIQQSTEVSRATAIRAAGELIRAIVATLKKTGKFTLSRFGTFTVHRTKARKALNPQTGASIRIKARKTVRFKASPVLKRAV